MIACRRYCRGLIEPRVFIVAYGLGNRLCALYDPGAFKFRSEFYDDIFVIGRRGRAVEQDFGTEMGQKLFDSFILSFVLFMYNNVEESKEKSFDSFSTIVEKGQTFYFRKIRLDCETLSRNGSISKENGDEGRKVMKGM